MLELFHMRLSTVYQTHRCLDWHRLTTGFDNMPGLAESCRARHVAWNGEVKPASAISNHTSPFDEIDHLLEEGAPVRYAWPFNRL
jgi:hypothetical protein